MGQYTDYFEGQIYEISPDDELDFQAKLIEIMKEFRPIHEVMDLFIYEHGYNGSPDNIKEKVSFMRNRFKEKTDNVIPRNIKMWFEPDCNPGFRFSRKYAFMICYAFDLKLEEINSFFSRCYLGRGFDYHNLLDLTFFFGITHHLSYSEIEELLNRFDQIEYSDNELKEVIFTNVIYQKISNIKNTRDFLNYCLSNKDQFRRNNTKAYSVINSLWCEICGDKRGKKGLATLEKERFFITDSEEVDSSIIESRNNKDNNNSPVSKSPKESLEAILWQIFGLQKGAIAIYKERRSLKGIIENNPLMHKIAESSFPDRNSLQKIILNKENADYESVRKTLILLEFYIFWIRKALLNNDMYYSKKAEYGDAERCHAVIDSLLEDTGYLSLYYGDPFDWIILYAMYDDTPLDTFRQYMKAMYRTIKQDEL